MNRTVVKCFVASGVVALLLAGCKQPNQDPYAPALPDGRTAGRIDTAYTFSSFVVDMDDDSVSIRFAWGDGDTSDWTPWMPSGDTAAMSHSWATGDTYEVRAQARDERDALSGWSPAHPIIIRAAWLRTYGGTGGEEGRAVRQTTDGGFIVVGFTGSWGQGSSDVYLIRTDAGGDTLWTRVYGGPYRDVGNSVEQTSEGGFVVAGYTFRDVFDSDVWLIRIDAQGATLWMRTYGGPMVDAASSVQQTADGGFIMAGWTESYGAGMNDVYVVRTDPEGETLWTRTIGGPSRDNAASAQLTTDGGLIIAGTTESFGAGEQDVYLIRTNAEGDTLWTRTYGWPEYDLGYSVQQTTDGGYIVTGRDESPETGEYEAYLIKTDADGDTLWTRTFAGTHAGQGYSVQLSFDGGFVIAGETNDDVYLIKTDANGDTLWTRGFGGADDEVGCSVRQTADGGYIVAGRTDSYGAGDDDVYLIKTDAEGHVSP